MVDKTIKSSIIIDKLSNLKNFDISESLNQTINIYNNTLHNATKANPLVVFRRTNEKLLWKRKIKNIIQSYSKNNAQNLSNDLTDKILIGNNIIIKRKKNNLVIIDKNKLSKSKKIILLLAKL